MRKKILICQTSNHLLFQTTFPKVDWHTCGKWLIHGTKHCKDNQLQSLELHCLWNILVENADLTKRSPLVACPIQYSERISMAYMDYIELDIHMDLDVRCLRKAAKFNHSLPFREVPGAETSLEDGQFQIKKHIVSESLNLWFNRNMDIIIPVISGNYHDEIKHY